MATAWVQGAFAFTDAASQASKAVVFGSNITAGSVIAVFVKYGTATSVFGSITDSQSNTYNAVDSIAGDASGANTSKTFYARNCAAGATTVTLNFTGSTGVYPRIEVHEISGVGTTAAVLDAHEIANQGPLNNNVATTDLISSAGSAVTTVNGCLILGIMVEYTGAEVFVAGTNFTLRTSGATPGNNFDVLYSESRVQSTAGSVHATFTNSNSLGTGKYFSAAMMAFAPPAAASFVAQRSTIVRQAVNRSNTY